MASNSEEDDEFEEDLIINIVPNEDETLDWNYTSQDKFASHKHNVTLEDDSAYDEPSLTEAKNSTISLENKPNKSYLINTCKPLGIKVVDCNKFPEYYKKYNYKIQNPSQDPAIEPEKFVKNTIKLEIEEKKQLEAIKDKEKAIQVNLKKNIGLIGLKIEGLRKISDVCSKSNVSKKINPENGFKCPSNNSSINTSLCNGRNINETLPSKIVSAEAKSRFLTDNSSIKQNLLIGKKNKTLDNKDTLDIRNITKYNQNISNNGQTSTSSRIQNKMPPKDAISNSILSELKEPVEDSKPSFEIQVQYEKPENPGEKITLHLVNTVFITNNKNDSEIDAAMPDHVFNSSSVSYANNYDKDMKTFKTQIHPTEGQEMRKETTTGFRKVLTKSTQNSPQSQSMTSYNNNAETTLGPSKQYLSNNAIKEHRVLPPSNPNYDYRAMYPAYDNSRFQQPLNPFNNQPIHPDHVKWLHGQANKQHNVNEKNETKPVKKSKPNYKETQKLPQHMGQYPPVSRQFSQPTDHLIHRHTLYPGSLPPSGEHWKFHPYPVAPPNYPLYGPNHPLNYHNNYGTEQKMIPQPIFGLPYNDPRYNPQLANYNADSQSRSFTNKQYGPPYNNSMAGLPSTNSNLLPSKNPSYNNQRPMLPSPDTPLSVQLSIPANVPDKPPPYYFPHQYVPQNNIQVKSPPPTSPMSDQSSINHVASYSGTNNNCLPSLIPPCLNSKPSPDRVSEFSNTHGRGPSHTSPQPSLKNPIPSPIHKQNSICEPMCDSRHQLSGSQQLPKSELEFHLTQGQPNRSQKPSQLELNLRNSSQVQQNSSKPSLIIPDKNISTPTPPHNVMDKNSSLHKKVPITSEQYAKDFYNTKPLSNTLVNDSNLTSSPAIVDDTIGFDSHGVIKKIKISVPTKYNYLPKVNNHFPNTVLKDKSKSPDLCISEFKEKSPSIKLDFTSRENQDPFEVFEIENENTQIQSSSKKAQGKHSSNYQMTDKFQYKTPSIDDTKTNIKANKRQSSNSEEKISTKQPKMPYLSMPILTLD